MQFGHFAETGQLQEDGVHVAADVDICRHQSVVGVDAAGAQVVVASAEMDVVLQLASVGAISLAAHDQHHFCVGLVAHHTIDHVGADLLQALRKVDVVGLIETRAQLDNHSDFLAFAGSVDQCINDRRLRASAVERLLDGKYGRVFGGLA